MAMSVKKGSFAANTSTGNQAITGVGFQPKAIIFWGVQETATGYSTGGFHFHGCATSSTQRWCYAGGADDGAGTVVSGRAMRSDCCIYTLANGTPTADGLADFVSMDSDGFTVNWTDAPASAWIIHYLCLGGTDITNAKAGTISPGTGTGSKSTTDPGFQPEFLLMATAATTSNTLTAHDAFGIGMVTGTSAKGTMTFRDKDALATSDIVSAQVSSKMLRMITTATGTALASDDDFTSFDATGFTYNRAISINQPLFYLAIAGGDWKVGVETSKTSTGTKATTGVGFKPAGLFAFSWGLAASASVDATQGKWSMGASDGTTEGFAWFESDDNNTATDVDDRTDTSKFIGMAAQPSTTQAEADVSSFDSDGFTLDWTTADAAAREFVYVAIGPGAGGTTYPQTISASSTATASLVKRVNVTKSVTSTGTASMLKRVSITPSASATGTASLLKRVNITKSVTATGTASITNIKLYNIILTATSTAAASLIKRANKIVAAASTGTASMLKRVSVTKAVTATGTPTLTKRVSITQSTSSTGTATTLKQANKPLLVNVAVTPNMIKRAGVVRAVTSTGTPSLLKQARITLSTTGTGTATMSQLKVVLITLSAAATGTATMLKRVGKILAGSSTATATLQRVTTFRVTMTATSIATPSIVKLVGKLLSASSTGSASITRGLQLSVLLSVTSTVTPSFSFVITPVARPDQNIGITNPRMHFRRRRSF